MPFWTAKESLSNFGTNFRYTKRKTLGGKKGSATKRWVKKPEGRVAPGPVEAREPWIRWMGQ